MFRDLIGAPLLWSPASAFVFPEGGDEWLPVSPALARFESQSVSETEFWRRFGPRRLPAFPPPFVIMDPRATALDEPAVSRASRRVFQSRRA